MGNWFSDNAGAIIGTAVAPGVGTLFGAQHDAGAQAAKGQAAIARTQEDLAREQLAIQKESRAKAIELSAPSFAELASVKNLVDQRDKTLGLQRIALDRQYKALEQVDEITKRQGEQVMALLDGQDNGRTTQARKQVDQARSKFEAQLADRLGSGWRTSSAGLEAMMRFEDQASTAMLNAQNVAFQQYAQLSGVQGQTIANIGGLEQIGQSANMGVIQAEDALKKRQMQAQLGSVPDYSTMIQTAGSGNMASILGARNVANTTGSIINVGTQLLGFAMGGAKGGASGGSPVGGAPTAGGEFSMGDTVGPSQGTSVYDGGRYSGKGF